MDRPIKSEHDLSNNAFYASGCTDHSADLGRDDELDQQRLSSDNKVCRVCGDKALSINFNVVTCESCKAFFRRNALKPKEFRCPFNGSCDITMASRKFCKKCRLRKCFDVGMMKEWIMTEEARLQKRQLIENNREKRKRIFGVESPPPPPKAKRKNSKIEIFDSPPATSSSLSSDERQPDTPPYYNNTPGKSMGDWSNSNGQNMDSGNKPTETTTSEISNADSITIPKSVLLNLINRCQQNSQNACPRCPTPPILTRALRLYELGGLDGLMALASEDGSTDNLFSKCICTCSCGAQRPSADSNNEAEISDKSVEASATGITIKEIEEKPPPMELDFADDTPGTSSSAFRQIDYNRAVHHPPMELGSVQNTASLGLPLQPYQGSGSVGYSQFYQELLTQRRVLDGMATELGYQGYSGANQQHTRYEIRDPVAGIKTAHAFVGRIIEMNKKLSTFRALTAKDQAALLQGGVREQMMIQSAINYNHEIDAWLPFGRNQPYLMPLEILNAMKAEVFDQHVQFIRSFEPGWSSDEVLMQIMAAIILFNPDRRGVVDVAGVVRQKQFYEGLMKQYLMTKYGQEQGSNIYQQLQERLEWLRRGVDQMQPTFHLELSSRDLSPLLVEMFY